MGLTILILALTLIILSLVYYYLKVYQPSKPTDHLSPYVMGLNYLVTGDRVNAKEKFVEAVRKDSENLDAYLKLGALYRQNGQVVPAIKVHQGLMVRQDLKPLMKMEVLKELALDYEQAGALRRAAEFADQMLGIEANNRWALSFRLRQAEKLQDWAAAFETARKLNAAQGERDLSKQALYRVEEARALIDEGKGKEGRVKCREALKLDRSCAHAYLTLAHSYMNEGREEDAVKELKSLLSANPDQGYLAYDLLENLYFNLGRFGDLESLYRDILEKRSDDLHAIQALARFLRKKGELESALQVCREGLERHPDDLWIRRFMIRTLMDNNRVQEAGPLVVEVLDRVLIEHSRYVCTNCGLQTDEPLWRCPRCSTLGAFNL